MSVDSTDDAAEAGPVGLDLPERLLASLLQEPSIRLAELAAGRATLVLPNGGRVVLLTCSVDTPRDELRATVDVVVGDSRRGVTHLVVVGGDGRVGQVLQASFPHWRIGRRFGFHQIDSDGVFRSIGAPMFELERAIARLPATAPLSPDEMAAHRGRGAAALEERRVAALRGFPWVTVAVGGLCIVLFGLACFAAAPMNMALFVLGANGGEHIADEPWRVLSSAFLHADLGHLAANMIALFTFGLVLERLLGVRRYLVLYGLSALGGGLASAFLGDNSLSVGASGAIWGLMGAGLGLAVRPRGLSMPIWLSGPRAAIPVVINFLYSFSPGIDFFAHGGGGLVGLALAVSGGLTVGSRPVAGASAAEVDRREPVALTFAALGLSIALVGSVAIALIVGRPWALGDPPVLTNVVVADTGVAVDLPTTIAGSPMETPDSPRHFVFGSLGDWVVAELVVSPPLPGGALEEVLDAARSAVERKAPRGADQIRKAEIVQVGGRRFVVAGYRSNGIVLRVWSCFLGDKMVALHIFARQELPASWAHVEEAIVASLAVR